MECTNPELGLNLTAYEFGWLCGEEARRFEVHLQGCRACMQDLWRMQPVWSVLQENPSLVEPMSNPINPSWWAWLGRSWRQVSIVASMMLMAGMVYLFQPPVEDKALLAQETVHLRQPGGNPSLAEGLQALRTGDTRQAKASFQKVLSHNPDSYEANYLLGLIILKEAEREMRLDPNKLNMTIARLQKAILLAERWENPVYVAQGYYYLARAYVDRKEPMKALEALTSVERLPAGDPDLGTIKQRAADLKTLCRP